MLYNNTIPSKQISLRKLYEIIALFPKSLGCTFVSNADDSFSFLSEIFRNRGKIAVARYYGKNITAGILVTQYFRCLNGKLHVRSIFSFDVRILLYSLYR